MKSLAPYLRPYLPMVLLAILLLFGQANADLALPDYMSRIVNVGIQQGGIDSAVPQELRSSTLERLLLFVPDAEVDAARDAFETGGAQEAAGADALLSLRSGLSADARARLDAILAPAWIVLGILDGTMARPGDMAARADGGMAPGATVSPSSLSGIDPASLPAAARARIVDGVAQGFEAMGPAALGQAAAAAVRAEYEAAGVDLAALQSAYILANGAVMLVLTLAGALATITVGFLSARVAAGLARDLRVGLFERIESFSAAEMDRFSAASLITRTTNDVMQVEMVAVMIIRMVFYAPIIGIGGVIRAMGKNADMWWIIAGAVGVLSILIVVVFKVAVPKFKVMQKLMDRLNLVSREALSGMMVVRAFTREDHEEKRFDSANAELTSTTLFVNRVMVVLMPLMMLIMNGLSLVIIWVGAEQVAASSMQVGDMMAFLQYAMQIVFAFLMLSMMFIMIPRAAVSAERIGEVLRTEPSIADPPARRAAEEGAAGTRIGSETLPVVEFDRVSFRYPGAEEDALREISFVAEPGSTTAIIGATGSGKSTIVNLIPRFYDVSSGAVRVGGVDVRDLPQQELRSVIGYVPQRAVLFSGSIESNLRLGDPDAQAAELDAAVAVAQAEEIVGSRGMQGEVAQAGANLSGGQKQRLAIARALVKRPGVYLFDDSFSALDYRTDANLRRALSARTAMSTVILVSQRVATIMQADRILVLDEGRIVGAGTHRELLESCETYREIAHSQLSEQELA